MTIITKPITEKKPDKSENLLDNAEKLASAPPRSDVEAPETEDAQFVVLRARARRVSAATTLCLFLTALMVMSIGIIGGVYLYRQYARAQMRHFRGWCNIPYDGIKPSMLVDENDVRSPLADSKIFQPIGRDGDLQMLDRGYFKEGFDIDLDDEEYEKIDVPDFQGGRKGRFIHDFNSNKTGIIDLDNRRCFVMPLNRGLVLPPRSLFDLIHKMWDGYYDVDTEVVRQTMRVVTPPVTDFKDMGTYISRECNDMPTYKLEKFDSPVFKRSADLADAAKFALFAGKKVWELDIINLNELEVYEKNNV